jgi:subtilisin family serine protease
VPSPDDNPDDCQGHGTHVAGIVGANGGGIVGVAPQVQLGAYRVFGCAGSTTSDIIIAALERALADGMQVINQSLGAARQWPQYPSAQASSRLARKGVVDGRGASHARLAHAPFAREEGELGVHNGGEN